MISKRKSGTVIGYCMASLIMFGTFASNISYGVTHLETNKKKVVADKNYVETNEITYGLVALEASSSIEEKKKAEEEAKRKAEEEARRKAEEERKRKAEEEKRRKEAEAKRKAEEAARKKAAEAAKKKAASSSTNKTSTASTSTSTPGNKDLGVQIANYAKRFVGNPYKSGGTSLTNGADCSGFVQSVYKHFGINLPRTARQQARSNLGRRVSFSELQPGDLVFYSNGGTNIDNIAHVAIYIGNGKIVHAQTPRLGIGITTYNIMTKVTARRIV